MKIVDRVRELEAMIGSFDSDYVVDYVYDGSGNVQNEIITVGTYVITTTFTYDIEGNVTTEEKVFGKKKVTKTYTYTNGIVTKVTVVNSVVIP